MKKVYALVALGIAGGFVFAMVRGGHDLGKAAGAAQPNEISLAVKIQTNKTVYKLGEPVAIVLSITNQSDQDLVLKFNTGQHYDVWAEKDEKEVWRWSHDRAFTQALNSLTLKAKETKTFTETWKQTGDDSGQVAPGAYTIYGQMTTTPPQPQTVSASITIGTSRAAVESTTIDAIISNIDAAIGRTVSISGTYVGWRPDPSSSACKDGPPITRADWAVSDGTGCIFATGRSGLDPSADYGKSITLIGTVKKTAKGQPYIEAQAVQVK